MILKNKHKIIYLVTAFAVTLFLSCDGKADEVRTMNLKSDAPVTEGRGINMKYTDSGKVTVHLKTPYIKDFANAINPFQEFPEGVKVIFKDKEGEENIITSEYAVLYKSTNLIDLQKNVKIFTSDSTTLTTEQLYWDQVNSWIFTNKPYTIVTKDGSTNDGGGFDANEKFTDFVSLNNITLQNVKENSEEL